jgi:hypothetical protein
MTEKIFSMNETIVKIGRRANLFKINKWLSPLTIVSEPEKIFSAFEKIF